MPVNAHPADTVMPPADTVEQYYAPQYLDGFPATEESPTILVVSPCISLIVEH